MKKLIVKFFAPLFMLLLCSFSLVIPVYAAHKNQEYKSTLDFQGEYEGLKRYYKYSHISYEATASAYVYKTPVSSNNTFYAKTYYVSLYRKRGFLFSDYIGKKALSRYKYGKATWTNVGSGNYYFRFDKARDGVTIKSRNVKMRSYKW